MPQVVVLPSALVIAKAPIPRLDRQQRVLASRWNPNKQYAYVQGGGWRGVSVVRPRDRSTAAEAEAIEGVLSWLLADRDNYCSWPLGLPWAGPGTVTATAIPQADGTIYFLLGGTKEGLAVGQFVWINQRTYKIVQYDGTGGRLVGSPWQGETSITLGFTNTIRARIEKVNPMPRDNGLYGPWQVEWSEWLS